MTRAVLVLGSDYVRKRAMHWISIAPTGTRLEFKAPRRTLDQNAKMWAMLTEIATQKEHCGRKYPAETWKSLFLHALGREMQFVPALDGHTFLPLGQRSSDLTKAEMSDLIELMSAWGAENGVVFREDTADAA